MTQERKRPLQVTWCETNGFRDEVFSVDKDFAYAHEGKIRVLGSNVGIVEICGEPAAGLGVSGVLDDILRLLDPESNFAWETSKLFGARFVGVIFSINGVKVVAGKHNADKDALICAYYQAKGNTGKGLFG